MIRKEERERERVIAIAYTNTIPFGDGERERERERGTTLLIILIILLRLYVFNNLFYVTSWCSGDPQLLSAQKSPRVKPETPWAQASDSGGQSLSL